MPINQITTANTFGQWITATQSVIALANTLTDGNGATFVANTILSVSGTGSFLNVANVAKVNSIVFYDGTTLSSNAAIISDVTNISTTAGTYGNASIIPVVTVAANGRISSVSNTTLSISSISNNTINVSGTNVGIGTSSPSDKLNIVTSAVNGGVTVSGSTDPQYYLLSSGSNAARFKINDSSSMVQFGSWTNIDTGFYTNGSERMRIDSSGNVGIGKIATSGVILDVNGVSRSTQIQMPNNAGTYTSGSAGFHLFGFSDNNLYFNWFDAGAIIFRNNGANERMRITSSGNVGIGTTSPGSALDVKGTLRLSGSSSGYVGFAPAAAAGSTTYTLPSADGTNGQVLQTNGSGALSWGFGVPTGTLLDFAGTSAPSGYLGCDGSAVSRTTYAALFAVIGTTWGAGNGSTTFNLPDFRRRVAVGSGGSGTGTLGNSVGNVGGAETHTLSTSEIPAHNHGVNDPTHNHSVNDPSHAHSVYDPSHAHSLTASNYPPPYVGGVSPNTPNFGNTTGNADKYYYSNYAGTGIGIYGAYTGISLYGNYTGITIQNTGGSGAHNNMQPSAVVLKIIKT